MTRALVRAPWTTLAMLAAATAPLAAQHDVGGSADHRLVERYRGARIIGYLRQQSTTYQLALGPVSDEYEHTRPLSVTGDVYRILYLAPRGPTAREVFDRYRRTLATGGFETLYACFADECGYLFARIAPDGAPLVEDAFRGLIRDHHYLAARATTPAGDVYVAVNVAVHESPNSWMADRTIARVDVVETHPDTPRIGTTTECSR